jgi:hypothetical protein
MEKAKASDVWCARCGKWTTHHTGGHRNPTGAEQSASENPPSKKESNG